MDRQSLVSRYRKHRAHSTMASECVLCGNPNTPCCTAQNMAPGLKGNGCMGSGVCIDNMCTTTKGTWHEPCIPNQVPCSSAFKGLKCVPDPQKGGDYWCDCGKGSNGLACTPDSVCGPQS